MNSPDMQEHFCGGKGNLAWLFIAPEKAFHTGRSRRKPSLPKIEEPISPASIPHAAARAMSSSTISGLLKAKGARSPGIGAAVPGALFKMPITTDLTAGSITRVTVDGKVVDSKNYTVSGSNVTLSDAYMKTLSNGKHTVAIENATKVAKATITVNNTTTATTAKPVTASKTGDAGIALYAGMAVASLLGTGVVITSRKRKVR